MLATSSADAVLILWDVGSGGSGSGSEEGGGGRRGRSCSISLHQRIQVRSLLRACGTHLFFVGGGGTVLVGWLPVACLCL